MTARLKALIDKQDNNEIIRDQIAAILAMEEANQVELAHAAGKDIENFDFEVYVERSRPWEILSTGEGDEISNTPLVNVLFDNDIMDNRNSNKTERQRTKGTFYIDCYAHKNRKPGKQTDLNVMGDELTSKESDKIARLVRNIIMSAEYHQLGLGYEELGVGKNIVFGRYIIKREKFTPLDREGKAFENIIATRLTLEVDYDEFSPQIEPTDFDWLYFKCTYNTITGQILFDALFDMKEEE